LLQPAGDVELIDRRRSDRHRRQPVQLLPESPVQILQIDSGFEQNGDRQPGVLFEQGRKEVFNVQQLVAATGGERTGCADGILDLFR